MTQIPILFFSLFLFFIHPLAAELGAGVADRTPGVAERVYWRRQNAVQLVQDHRDQLGRELHVGEGGYRVRDGVSFSGLRQARRTHSFDLGLEADRWAMVLVRCAV